MCVTALLVAISVITLPQRSLSALVRRTALGRALRTGVTMWLWADAALRVGSALALSYAVLSLMGGAPLSAAVVIAARVAAVASVWPNATAAAAAAAVGRVHTLLKSQRRRGTDPGTEEAAPAAAAAFATLARQALVAAAAQCGAPLVVRSGGSGSGPSALAGVEHNPDQAVACAAGIAPAVGILHKGAAPAWPYVHGGFFAAAPFMLRCARTR